MKATQGVKLLILSLQIILVAGEYLEARTECNETTAFVYFLGELESDRVTFDEAADICVEEGGILARIDNDEVANIKQALDDRRNESFTSFLSFLASGEYIQARTECKNGTSFVYFLGEVEETDRVNSDQSETDGEGSDIRQFDPVFPASAFSFKFVSIVILIGLAKLRLQKVKSDPFARNRTQ